MAAAVDELGEAYAKVGARSKPAAMSLARMVVRQKARSLTWRVAPTKA
jgi:hypothetical protein